MNTTGIQNYLSNVFLPIYIYDPVNSNFTPRLELSNIDTYSGNAISVFTAGVGDSKGNVYVGKGAGNAYNSPQACSNVTALGFTAAGGISNDSNSVYIGYNAGFNSSNAKDIISIGSKSGRSGGASNIFIGSNTGTIGSSNILIGHSMDLSSVSNQVRIGYSKTIPIAADICLNWVGLGGVLEPSNITYANLDISGSTRVQGNLGINIQPGEYTMDVNGNFRARDASGNVLDFLSNGFTRSTGGFGSIQSNISVPTGTTPIGQIKKGIIHVCAVDQASTANRAAKTYFAWTTSDVTIMNDVSAGNTNITTSSTNIQISNSGSSSTYNYNITYFPLP